MRTPALPPRYRLVGPLGSGSFATVVVAEDVVLGRQVAVKVLRRELAGDAGARARFTRETRAGALVGDHPHVVTVHDAGEWDGLPFLVLELLAGSVADRLAGGRPVPDAVALLWLAQAAEALDFVHARGLVHRDVKPANLLLDDRGDVRLADFGVVTGAAAGGGLTVTGEVVGTPGYLAPEVARGAPALPASDRYSLAVVARELLGDRPALVRALADEPADRHDSAAALVADLGGGERTTRIALLPPTKVAAPEPTARLRRHRSVRWGRAFAVLAAVAAASAAAGTHLASWLPLGGAAPAAARGETCAMSPFDRDANIIVAGVGANRFCKSQAHVLRLRGDRWTYRAGGELIAPDHGAGDLAIVCKLRSSRLRATVYDSGSQRIGRDVCDWYASGGWRDSSVT
jgi:serine/threonine-protein kinase